MRGIYHEGFTMREVSPEVFHHGSHHFRADDFQYSYFLLMHIDQKIINEYVHPKKKT